MFWVLQNHFKVFVNKNLKLCVFKIIFIIAISFCLPFHCSCGGISAVTADVFATCKVNISVYLLIASLALTTRAGILLASTLFCMTTDWFVKLLILTGTIAEL